MTQTSWKTAAIFSIVSSILFSVLAIIVLTLTLWQRANFSETDPSLYDLAAKGDVDGYYAYFTLQTEEGEEQYTGWFSADCAEMTDDNGQALGYYTPLTISVETLDYRVQQNQVEA